MSTGLEVLDAGLPTGTVGCFTTRSGGVSPAPWDSLNLGSHVGDDLARATTNAQRLMTRLGVVGLNLPQQVHGSDVLVVDAAAPGLRIHAGASGLDALVTAGAGIAIGVLVADCMPVLLADPDGGIVAAVHAGRRGLAAGVLQATLHAMAEQGADLGRVTAVIGPAICGACYEVPADLREEVAEAVPGTAAETRSGTPALDLPAGALGILKAAGVAEARSVGICTAEDGRFFSYRRDGITGRFAGVVMLSAHG